MELEGNQNKNNSLVSNFYSKLKSPALFSHLFHMEKNAGNFNLLLWKLLTTRQLFSFWFASKGWDWFFLLLFLIKFLKNTNILSGLRSLVKKYCKYQDSGKAFPEWKWFLCDNLAPPKEALSIPSFHRRCIDPCFNPLADKIKEH